MSNEHTALPTETRSVRIDAASVALNGDLAIPQHARGVVVFAHGSGSSRFSARNKHVAVLLQESGFATLLIDLLTPNEEDVDRRTREYRFDIERLAERLVGVSEWVSTAPATAKLPVSLFGASTGGAAALVAAALEPGRIAAVVSRGGRPDLAGERLARVRAPTLLIVGGDDEPILELNREALSLLTAPARLEVIPGATHLFEEPGALDEVARHAVAWLESYATRAS
ncbi:MAG: dienelactone hydrolase family protein [Gemmatimonadaceae bacterium]